MNSQELESKIEELKQEYFNLYVRDEMKSMLKKFGFKKIEFSMGGAVLTYNDGNTIVDNDVAKIPEMKDFYKKYLEPLIMIGKHQTILYGIDFDMDIE